MKRIISTFIVCTLICSANAEIINLKHQSITPINESITKVNSNDTFVNSSLSTDTIPPTIENNSYIVDGEDKSVTFIWNKRNRKKLSPHWSGMGMSFINYSDKNIPHGSIKMSSSHNFTLNIMSFGKQIGRSNWQIVTGLGFDWSRYHFDDNAALTKIDGITQFVPAPEGVSYKSTKMLSYYITIPLMLEYQVKGFHASTGAVIFFKYYSKSQVKYYDEDGKHKDNMGKDLNIRPIDLRLKTQIGIDNVSLFGYYAPLSLFKKDKGPELKTYAVGVMLHF